jgi:hypothetical protein
MGRAERRRAQRAEAEPGPFAAKKFGLKVGESDGFLFCSQSKKGAKYDSPVAV